MYGRLFLEEGGSKKGWKGAVHQHQNEHEFWQDLYPSGLFQGLIKVDALPELNHGIDNLTDPVTMIRILTNYLM